MIRTGSSGFPKYIAFSLGNPIQVIASSNNLAMVKEAANYAPEKYKGLPIIIVKVMYTNR